MRRFFTTSVYRALVASLVFTVVVGFGYGFAATGVAQGLFPFQANGSITANGSVLIGQRWSGPRWFHGRPGTYNPTTSGASNLGPRSALLAAEVRRRLAAARRLGDRHPTESLLVGSGSGVDPQISPSAALAQVGQVSAACALAPATVRRLVEGHVRPPGLGIAGEPVVDVLQLNEALARICRPAPGGVGS